MKNLWLTSCKLLLRMGIILLKFFDTIISENFANINAKKLYFIANSPIEAINYLKNYTFEKTNFGKEELLKHAG